MHRLVLIAALALTAPPDPQAQEDSTGVIAELTRLDQEWQEAVVRGDTALLDKRTADGFTFTHGGGRSDTKTDWLRKQVPGRFLERKTSDYSVEVHGDIALVFGRVDVRVSGSADSGPSCYAMAYVHLSARQSGQWMLLSHRTTQVFEEPHPCAQK